MAPRFWGALSLVLLLGGLLALQVSFVGARLIYELPAYGLVAIAALIAWCTVRSPSTPDLICFTSTALFCGYIAVRALLSPSPYYARADLYSVLAAATVYALAAVFFTGAGSRMAIIAALLAFALSHVLVSLVQFGIGDNLILIPALRQVEATSRPTGLYGGPAYLAGLLEVLGIFAVSLTAWSRWPKWAKTVVCYLAIVCYVGLAFTGARGGYLSALTSLVVFAALSLLALRSGGSSLFWKSGVVGILALVVLVWAGASLIKESSFLAKRLDQIVATEHQDRFYLWQAAIEQWTLQPWTGTGSGTYRFYGRQFRAEQMQQDPVMVHNDYLHLLSEYGIFGAATFVLFLGAHLWRGWCSFRVLGPQRIASGGFPLSDRLALNIGAIAAISAYVVHSAVDFNLHIPANALLLAFVFGIVANPGLEGDSANGNKMLLLVPKLFTASLAAVLLVECVRVLPGEYYTNRARLALEDEKPAEALALAEKALTWEKENPRVFFYLGRALSATGDDKIRAESRISYYEAALGAFDKARLLNPLDGSHPFDMAVLYDRMGRFEEAEWMYYLARERDPRSSSYEDQYRTHLRLWERSGS